MSGQRARGFKVLSVEERDEIVRSKWAESALEYGDLAVELPSYVESNRALVDAVDLRPGHRVLDLACGGGATLVAAFAAQPELAEAWAVDWVEEMTAQVPRLLPGLPIRTRVAPAQDFARVLDGQTVDRVVCNGAFFQFEAPQTVLAEVAKVLGPEGKLGLTLPGPSNTIHFIEHFHRLGLTKPLQGGPGGPGSLLGDRCTMRNVDVVLAGAGWRLVAKKLITVQTSQENYARWLSLPVFRRPEWMDWSREELRERLGEALQQTEEEPVLQWLVVVARPPDR